MIGGALALVLGVALVPLYLLFVPQGPLWVRLVIALGLSYTMLVVPFGFPIVLVMGLMKLREQRRHEMDELGDENVVMSHPDGERKLHDYLTAITSTEARIGLLQRSAPYIPPEKRPPSDATLPRATVPPAGRRMVGILLCGGAAMGLLLGWIHGVDATPGRTTGWGFQPIGLARLALSGALGMLATLPLALLVAAFYAKVKERDDGGADRPEAA